MTVLCHGVNVTVTGLGLNDERSPGLADLG
jgi:hypothetical protein